MPRYINEASAANMHARFFDTSNALTSPASVRYLIRDLTNDREVRSWTDVAPAAELDIPITADDNAMLDTRKRKRFEHRVVTVQANVGLETQFTEETHYWLRNLEGIV